MNFHPAITFYRKLVDPPVKDLKEPGKTCFGKFARNANTAYKDGEFTRLIEQIDKQQESLVETARQSGLDAASLVATTNTRLIVGLSHGRLWNAGFQIHPVYGVPYLPASGIKGALWHFRREEEGEAAERELAYWFGNEEQRGAVMLFDAFPVLPGRNTFFTEDILNKHHENYYEQKEEKEKQIPADYNEPSPVKFLAISTGVKFRFVYAIEPSREDRPSPTLEVFRETLAACLAHAGMGAKTRKGYGRMRV